MENIYQVNEIRDGYVIPLCRGSYNFCIKTKNENPNLTLDLFLVEE